MAIFISYVKLPEGSWYSWAMSKIPLMMGEFAGGSWFVGIMTQGMEYLRTNQYT